MFHVKRNLFWVRAWWGRAATRMALVYAARGTVAMLVPFFVLLALGLAYGGVIASLGGLFAVLADTGGSYRQRLGAMLWALVAGAAALYLGARMADMIWLLPLVLALIAFGNGMGRVFGGSGHAIGLAASIMFLVGALSPTQATHAALLAGYYMLGIAWFMAMHVTQWWLRPYSILLQEIAACYDACARLVTALEFAAGGRSSAVTHRRIRFLHQSARESIRDAETTLEALRVGSGYSSQHFDRALLLLEAVSREVIAATGLRNMDWPPPDSAAAQAWRALFASWRKTLIEVSRLLLTGRGPVATTVMHAAFDTLESQGELTRSQAAPLRLALLHMDSAVETGPKLTDLRLSWRDALPQPSIDKLRTAWEAIAAHWTLRSIVLRHALRVAAAAGFGLWFAGFANLPHPLWLPMTTILVLQPEFGATWQRMGQRIIGTLTGVLIAGGLHLLIHDSLAELAVIIFFSFTSFYFIRSAYGLGVVLLTPMVLLLLGVLQPQASGMLIVARGIDTVIGGLVALAAAYLLWPSWQRDAFLPECATALRAEREYLAGVFDQPGDGELSRPELMRARHAAERAGDNADATLRRMLAEPSKTRGDTRAALNFMTYLRRLEDNAADFSVALGGDMLSPQEREQGDTVLRRLDLIAAVLAGQAAPDTLTEIAPQSAEALPTDAALTLWFERFIADTGLLAVATRQLIESP